MLNKNKGLLTIYYFLFAIMVTVISPSANSQSDDNAAAKNMLPSALLLLDNENEDTSSVGVNARLKSLTRLNGVSPETVYFSAELSTCSQCVDLWGLNTRIADAYSELAYYFDFDDADSGNFKTTGNSRNRQVSSLPRAAHTFHCFGEDDVNWDPADQRCEFDVGVRVQAKDGDYDDAFIRVNIQPAVGVGGYYVDQDVVCVSSTSEFADCLALAPGASTSIDVPSLGNWDNTLAIIDNNGATYSRVCMGADEQHGAAIAYGPNLVSGIDAGARPIISSSNLSSRPAPYSCSEIFTTREIIDGLQDSIPERNHAGELIKGWGFGNKVVGLRVGYVAQAQSYNFIQYHDISMDWSGYDVVNDEGNVIYRGYFKVSNNTDVCTESTVQDCDKIPYPSFLMLTDSHIESDESNLASPVNIGCFSACSLVNTVIMGTEVATAVEHNLRIQGTWGMILSNNWFRGNHIGGKGGKSRVTLRENSTGVLGDVNENPENALDQGLGRASGVTNLPINSFNLAVDNWINQESHLEGHVSAAWFVVGGRWHLEYGTNYIDDNGQSGAQQGLQSGLYRVIRNITWAPNAASQCVTAGIDLNQNNDSSTTFYEDTVACSGQQFFVMNTPKLSIPTAPDR